MGRLPFFLSCFTGADVRGAPLRGAPTSSEAVVDAVPAPPRLDSSNSRISPKESSWRTTSLCSAPSSSPTVDQDLKGPGWSKELLRAFPFSWAVVTSDACHVLDHGLGSEPAAAQVLQQVLLSVGSQPPDSVQGSPHCAKPVQEGASSFLATLLGPQMKAAALKGAKMGRPWKETISMWLPATKHTSDSSASCSIHVSPAEEKAACLSTEKASSVFPRSIHASPAPSAAAEEGGQEEEEHRAQEMAVRVSTEKASNPCPRQPSPKGRIRFQSAGLDQERSREGAKQSVKGLRWGCVPSDPVLVTRDSSIGPGIEETPGRLSDKFDSPMGPGIEGTPGCLSDEFEGSYEFAPNRPQEPRPNQDCTAHHAGIHAQEDGLLNWGKDAPLASIFSSQNRQLRGSKSMGSRVKRRGSLRLSEKEIEDFMRQDTNSLDSPNLRTRALLKSLSHNEYPQGENSVEHGSRLPGSDAEHLAQQKESCSAATQSAVFETEIESLDMDVDATDATASVPQPGSSGGSAMHSFDVVVSAVDCSKGERSPLTVVITDSTEHLKARSILTTLAESQLELLANIIPQHVIKFLAMESSEAVPEHVGQLARSHKSATLMFMDVCGFTEMSKEVAPVQVMIFLNNLFSRFDKLVDIHGVHKVETAGDCYIVSGGIMKRTDGLGQMEVEESHDPAESARRVMDFATAILDAAGQVEMPNTQQPARIRIGMHTGDVVSGMIGTKLPKFSIFGDTMNTASRMESTGVPGRIHVSEATARLLPNDEWQATGGVQVKGKGQMESFLWVPPYRGFDTNCSIPLPSGLKEAQQRVQGNSIPLPALSPAIRLLCSPLSGSHAIMPCDMLKEWEQGWTQRNWSTNVHKETSRQPSLEARAASSSMLPSEIIKATQTLSRRLCKLDG